MYVKKKVKVVFEREREGAESIGCSEDGERIGSCDHLDENACRVEIPYNENPFESSYADVLARLQLLPHFLENLSCLLLSMNGMNGSDEMRPTSVPGFIF